MFNIAKRKDEKLFQALKQDGIKVTEHEIQKVREDDPETLYKIGDIYCKKYEYEKALPWLHKAALQNHSEAQAKLGDMFRHGDYVLRDSKKAMDWSMKAASAGNAEAQYLVGNLYYWGEGVLIDYKQAMYWYLKAENNGHTDAMNKIGFMYRDGKGVTKNIRTAIEWHTEAANQGNAWAQYKLGDIYKTKDEVKNLQKAVNWYQKAADNNYYPAKYYVEELNKQGYYAKEDEQEANILVEETISDGDAINGIINDQNQSFTTTNNNDENSNKSIDDKLKEMELKINLIQQKYEGNSDALQKELASLKQKELDQKEENRLLKERLADVNAEREDNVNNDLNYDSSDDEIDDKNDINYDSECSKGEQEQDIHPTAESNVIERKNNVLHNDFTTPKQENHQQAEENQPLQGRPARMEAGVQDDVNNDLNYDSASNGNDDNNDINYDSSDNENDSNNDINYDSQCSDIEEDNANKVIPVTQQIHDHSVKTYADPNYASSDNE